MAHSWTLRTDDRHDVTKKMEMPCIWTIYTARYYKNKYNTHLYVWRIGWFNKALTVYVHDNGHDQSMFKLFDLTTLWDIGDTILNVEH